MHPQYDFLSAQREQLVIQTRQQEMVRGNSTRQPGIGGKMLSGLGDVLIASGSWLKKTGQSPIDDKSVSYSQNY